MTNPTQNRAGEYLQKKLKTITDDPAPQKAIDVLIQCSELADQDFAECNTSEQKQKVWAALLAAVNLVIRSHGGDAIASLALGEALTNTSLGRPGTQDLVSSAIPNTHTIDNEWIRACTIALLDEHPKNRQQTCKDAVRFLGGDEASIKKMRANFRSGGVGGDVLNSLVETAKSFIKEFGHDKLSDLSDAKPPPRT